MVFDSLSLCLVVGPPSQRRCTWRCWGCVRLYNWCMPWWQQTTRDPDRSLLELSYWLCWRTIALIWFYRSFRNCKTKQQTVRKSLGWLKKNVYPKKNPFKKLIIFLQMTQIRVCSTMLCWMTWRRVQISGTVWWRFYRIRATRKRPPMSCLPSLSCLPWKLSSIRV